MRAAFTLTQKLRSRFPVKYVVIKQYRVVELGYNDEICFLTRTCSVR
jgi:hypothetical protein